MVITNENVNEEIVGRFIGNMSAERLRLPDGTTDSEILAICFSSTESSEPLRITIDETAERFEFEHKLFECIDLGEYGKIVSTPVFSATDDVSNCQVLSVEHLTTLHEDRLNLKLSDSRVLSVWVTGDVIYASLSEPSLEDV